MASPALITPTTAKLNPLPAPIKSSKTAIPTASIQNGTAAVTLPTHRRQFMSVVAAGFLSAALLIPVPAARAASEDEYVKDTEEVIGKIRNTINMDKTDPKVAVAVADLREASNFWVAKYRKEKALLGRPSFRDIYSALNAVSGHYISFGPTAPIPAKRKTRILEETESAEKALVRGR